MLPTLIFSRGSQHESPFRTGTEIVLLPGGNGLEVGLGRCETKFLC
jgi:hypothetical protein